ncbi:hypothetical protein AB0I91_19595 [Actinosynnema sp. NPDC049800]
MLSFTDHAVNDPEEWSQLAEIRVPNLQEPEFVTQVGRPGHPNGEFGGRERSTRGR